MRDLGNARANFAWTDLRAIVNRAYDDTSMQLHRVINPDWRFADPTTYLLAEIATIASSARFIEVARAWDEEENGPVPEAYWPSTYGPPTDEDASQSSESDDDQQAREAAAEFVAMQQSASRR